MEPGQMRPQECLDNHSPSPLPFPPQRQLWQNLKSRPSSQGHEAWAGLANWLLILTANTRVPCWVDSGTQRLSPELTSTTHTPAQLGVEAPLSTTLGTGQEQFLFWEVA